MSLLLYLRYKSFWISKSYFSGWNYHWTEHPSY